MKKISTSTYTFKDLIEGECLYVDKTEYLYRLVSEPKGQFFLARPRRFGKSLTVSTLDSIFSGEAELFKDLIIVQKYHYDFEPYPVIHLDFSVLETGTVEELAEALLDWMKNTADKYHLTLEEDHPVRGFRKLIREMNQVTGKKVVLLIDEYDKPVLDHLHDGNVQEMQKFMNSFYQVIKGSEPYFRFVFMTGITRFSKLSIFSTLNNLLDITLNPNYAALTGYTQEELENGFAEYINDEMFSSIKDNDGMPLGKEKALDQLKYWYDGFRFVPDQETVYNPVSVGMFFQSQCTFSNYWFSTATPKFLTEVFRKNHFLQSDLEKAVFRDVSFNTFDIVELSGNEVSTDRINQLLFQTGYLTIGEVQRRFPQLSCTMKIPNYEVEISLMDILMKIYSGSTNTDGLTNGFQESAVNGDTDGMISYLKTYLASIPYDIQEKTEKFYHSMAYMFFFLCGMDISSEEKTNVGRIDAVLETEKHLYIIEYKIDQSAEAAVSQIEEKKYSEKYMHSGKTIHQLGINFSSSERNIQDWKEKIVS